MLTRQLGVGEFDFGHCVLGVWWALLSMVVGGWFCGLCGCRCCKRYCCAEVGSAGWVCCVFAGFVWWLAWWVWFLVFWVGADCLCGGWCMLIYSRMMGFCGFSGTIRDFSVWVQFVGVAWPVCWVVWLICLGGV